MGAVGVEGVDMSPLDDGDDSSSSDGSSREASRRFACVGTLLPMTLSRSGAEKVYEVWLVVVFFFRLLVFSSKLSWSVSVTLCEPLGRTIETQTILMVVYSRGGD